MVVYLLEASTLAHVPQMGHVEPINARYGPAMVAVAMWTVHTTGVGTNLF